MKTEIKLFTTFFVLFLIFAHWTGGNENLRLALVESIVNQGRLTIDPYANVTDDRFAYGGHYYSDTIGLSTLAIPSYAIWTSVYTIFPQNFRDANIGTNNYETRLFGTVPIYLYTNPGFFYLVSMILVTIFTSSLFGALLVVLIYKSGKFFTNNKSHWLLAALVLGLGTIIFQYASVFMDHAVAAFMLFLAFYMLLKCKHEKIKRSYFLLSGLIFGYSVLISPYLIVTFIGFALFIMWSFKKLNLLFLFMGGAILGILPMLVMNQTVFGTPFQLLESHLDQSIWNVPNAELNNFGFLPSPQDIFIFFRLLLGPYRGLLFYSPILILGAVGLYIARRNRPQFFSILIVILSVVVIFSARYDWWGNYAFGSRFLVPIIPFLVLPLFFALRKLPLVVVIVFLTISLFVNVLGLQHWEDTLWNQDQMRIDTKYSGTQYSFSIISNPLPNYYVPLLLADGPRSRLLENFLNGRFTQPDIRDELDYYDGGNGLPAFVKIKSDVALSLIIMLIVIAIWHENLVKFVVKMSQISRDRKRIF